jgi:DinB superfamily
MDPLIKTAVWQQFGASIDMLADAMRACPDELWSAPLWNDPDGQQAYAQFWYRVYHTLSWLDLYLSGSAEEDFTPPAPFKRGVLPETPYTKDQLRAYLEHGRSKCRSTIEALTDERARQRCKYEWMDLSFFELLLYTMRHVQEHGAQLHMFLGQHDIAVNDWVPIAEN